MVLPCDQRYEGGTRITQSAECTDTPSGYSYLFQGLGIPCSDISSKVVQNAFIARVWIDFFLPYRHLLQVQNICVSNNTRAYTIHPKYAKYAFYCGLISTDFTDIVRSRPRNKRRNLWVGWCFYFNVTSLAPWQSYYCPSASEVTMNDMGKSAP